MTIISENDIKHVANLARLAIDDTEMAHYTQDLTKILQLVAQMQQCDTTNVPAASHSLDFSLTLRDDQVTETDQQQRLQQLTTHIAKNYYLVPQVLDEE